MKFNGKKLVFTLSLIATLLVVSGNIFAQSTTSLNSNARPNRVVGLWDVDVVVSNCTTGAVMTSFSALHLYNLGGTGQVVPSAPPILLSPHMAIWKHIEGNDFEQTIKMFRFNAEGELVGWNVITNDVTISADGEDLVGSGVASIYNAAGVKVAESCPALVGTRFTGE